MGLLKSIKRRIPNQIKQLYWNPGLCRVLYLLLLEHGPYVVYLYLRGLGTSTPFAYVTSKGQSMYLRAGQIADYWIFGEVFVDIEYGPVSKCVENPKVILDLGANIGLTSLYLHRLYPQARIIALEPDQDNYSLACRNLSICGENILLLQAGIWHRDAPLRVVRTGGPATYQVEECHNGETAEVQGICMESLMSRYGLDSIDILKIDIEGAERVLFEHDCNWLTKVRALAVEPHSEEIRKLIESKLEKYGFEHRFQSRTLFARRKE
ncbi:MAG: hypothetical protein C4297_01130 [Gemmataceae bacterium]